MFVLVRHIHTRHKECDTRSKFILPHTVSNGLASKFVLIYEVNGHQKATTNRIKIRRISRIRQRRRRRRSQEKLAFVYFSWLPPRATPNIRRNNKFLILQIARKHQRSNERIILRSWSLLLIFMYAALLFVRFFLLLLLRTLFVRTWWELCVLL